MGLLNYLLTSRSMENPAESLDDPALWDALGARTSESGVRVNREIALEHSPIWRAVNLISRDVGRIPMILYRRIEVAGGDGKERAKDHPVFKLLHRKPNSEMTPFIFKQLLQSQALLDGNGLAYIVRQGDATPVELIPLLPGKSYPVRVNGIVWYVTNVNGETVKLPARDVFHIKGLGFDGLSGYPVWKKAKNAWGIGIAARNYGGRFFRNGAQPSVVLEHPGKLSKEAASRLVENWEKMHSGLENQHRAAVLEEGMKASIVSATARNSQLLETRSFDIIEVADWFNLPPHKLGDRTRAGYASLEQENQSYLDDALDPWFVNWEEEASEKLLSEDEKDSDIYCIEFLRQALLQTNLEDRANYYKAALGGRPWMLQNEVRALENMNPVEGGDKMLDPLNMAPAGDGGAATATDEDEPAKKDDEEDDETDDTDPADPDKPKKGKKGDEKYSAAAVAASRTVLIDVTRRMIKRIGVHARRSAKDLDSLKAFIAQGIDRDHRSVLLSSMQPALAVHSELRGKSIDAAVCVDALIHDFRVSLETQIATDDSVDCIARRLDAHEAAAPEKFVDRLFPES